jgi:spore germination protein KC
MEKIPSTNISKLVEGHAAATSQTRIVRLRDFASRLMSKTTAPVVPMIGVIRENGQKALKIDGTAVFKDGKMVGEMNDNESRGLLWVLGEVKSGIVKVKASETSTADIEIIRASGKMEPEIKNGKVTIKVKINEEGNIGEETGDENLSMPPAVESLERKTSEAIRSEVMEAVAKAQQLNADVFGFGDAVHRRYPKQWKDMEKKWDEIFPGIAAEVNVQSKIRLMGKINKPMVPEKK